MATADSLSKPAQFDFAKERVKIKHLIGQWAEEETATKFRRDVRKKEVNVTEEQAKGKIREDQTLITRRIIDRNIRLEKPELVAYLEQSPRTVLFKSLSQPTRDTVPLADWFTLGVRYKGWAEPWHRLIDSTCLHGAGWIEVRYDIDKPFNLALEYTPRECLIFPRKLRKSFQKCEMILRVYEYLPNELEDAVEAYGFNAAVVKKLTQTQQEGINREIPIKVYKVFRRKEGIIYVGWYAEETDGETWLKTPAPLSFGISEDGTKLKPISSFPFFAYLYEFTEEEEFLACKGRAARDIADQDAISQTWTAIVNGTNAAAEIHASFEADPANPDGQQAVKIEPGTIIAKPVRHFQAQYPDPFILSVVQSLSTENLQSAGKVDYAAQNRVDSRKTATEINSARDQSARLSSINVVPLAACITDVYTFMWNVVQEQISYSLANPEAPLIPIPEHIDPINWTDVYELAPAGDVEVIKRAEKLANLQQDLSLFAGTPVYQALVSKYLELRFPDESASLKALLAQADPAPILAAFVQLMSTMPMNLFTPEQQAQIQALMENATVAVNAAGGAPAMAGNRPNPNSAPPPPANGGSPLSPSTSPLKNS